ncbi:MAG: peptidylprolyl isomerase [Sulfurimonas sp. RIFOXYD12_FULL_33_39]|uniref:peptidylprolyl isomerase n=1 Tax=unclassified Sulfurimonas TaxID=2623549 RepID=UPI0008BE4EE2|nr:MULTISPECIES: peptidylprolyl isomerase [unclassified Sulfurimonas]OHE08751.1 MAG: peptidylprolyl isomerase [Sulfurimonas sp. RIFOXYD12_FULL_33_39]OHE14036.1 MAG: peptidylprolyl isomerase [Sulfurimonas sp. RIFOXYD2_FULL_34_21]DAB27642.1 MAG TPA: peptidylprolyl isomerase [Sulfurimonas sp. UBA10385]
MKTVTKAVVSLAILSTISMAQTLVTVNGTQITQQDVDRELMSATQGRFNQVPAEKQAEFRKQVLEQLVAKELVYDDAKKTGILNSNEFKNKYEEVAQRVKKEVAIQVWQKQELDKITISDKEKEEYYNKNKEEFIENESINARHILVEKEADAKDIIAQLKPLKGDALKNKFIELAKAKSTCTSAPNGGDLGYFTEGQMVPEFNNKAFSMKAKEITLEPVKTQFGYHVIYIEDKKAKTTKSFSEVKQFIEQRLKMEKAKTMMMAKMEELKKKAEIK